MGNSAEHGSAWATALASRMLSEASCNTQIVRSPTTHQASEDTQNLGVGTAVQETWGSAHGHNYLLEVRNYYTSCSTHVCSNKWPTVLRSCPWWTPCYILSHPLKANINQVFWQIAVYGQGATVKEGTLRGNQVAHERDMGKGSRPNSEVRKQPLNLCGRKT